MKTNKYYKKSKSLNATVLLFAFFLLSSPAAFAQDFSSIDTDLLALENLLQDTIANTAEQQKLLDDLRQSLNESGNLIERYENRITEQENLLKDLQIQLSAMYETFTTQSALSARYELRLKRWKIFTLAGIPVAAVISSLVVWGAVK